MDLLSWLSFILIGALLVIIVIAIARFWQNTVNLSDEDVALERRVGQLNEGQANRRRDDEIVRLLRGDEQRVVGDEPEDRRA